MNNQAKFLVSMLFLVVIILCAVLTRFYVDVTKNTESSARDNRVASVGRSFGNDVHVFQSVNHFYGLLDGEQSVLIEPEWLEILDVTSNMVLVSSEMDGKVLIGGIDYEENVVLPFVFDSMSQLENGCHVGTVEADKSCIVYDAQYQPLFFRSFHAVSCDRSLLILKTDNNTLCYDTVSGSPVLTSAEFSCPVTKTLSLNWKISNQMYLSNLNAEDLLRMNHVVSAYMQMLLENDFSGLAEISESEYFSKLSGTAFAGRKPETIGSFSLYQRESGAYDFSFRMTLDSSEHTEMHLYFRRNAENKLILTASGIQPVAEE